MTAPYYSDDAVSLYHGDYREVLPDLGLTADLILADPPYGETSLAWDRWPVGWPTDLAVYGRSMWCFGSMRMFLDRRDEFAGWKLSQDVVWEKHNGSGFHDDRFRRVHEFALHWYIGDWAGTYHHPPRDGRDRPSQRIRRGATPHLSSQGGEGLVGGEGLRRSVIFAASMHGNAINETEKPTGLLEPLITYGCRIGGLILDPFAGSGSTLDAARAIGRRAVGVEKRERQCELAARRLSQSVMSA